MELNLAPLGLSETEFFSLSSVAEVALETPESSALLVVSVTFESSAAAALDESLSSSDDKSGAFERADLPLSTFSEFGFPTETSETSASSFTEESLSVPFLDLAVSPGLVVTLLVVPSVFALMTLRSFFTRRAFLKLSL